MDHDDCFSSRCTIFTHTHTHIYYSQRLAGPPEEIQQPGYLLLLCVSMCSLHFPPALFCETIPWVSCWDVLFLQQQALESGALWEDRSFPLVLSVFCHVSKVLSFISYHTIHDCRKHSVTHMLNVYMSCLTMQGFVDYYIFQHPFWQSLLSGIKEL